MRYSPTKKLNTLKCAQVAIRFARLVLDKITGKKDFVAAVLELAHLGYLEIDQKEKKLDPILIRKKRSTETLRMDQKYLLDHVLFKGKDRFILSAGSESKASALQQGFKYINTNIYTWSVADGYMVENQKNLKVFKSATLEEVDGFIGNFNLSINQDNNITEIKVGAIIVATGAVPLTPEGYYNYNGKNIISQLELEQILKEDKVAAKSIAMIKCVGCRNEERKYCSNICCMSALKNAVKNEYTIGIGGDVSEAGISAHDEVAMVPSFDIPSQYIDENAGQFSFRNRSTTDDHGIHVVGYQNRDNGTWFLIKDSGSGGHTGPHSGYYFYHEDYIKLKMMNFIVHKDAVKELMSNF